MKRLVLSAIVVLCTASMMPNATFAQRWSVSANAVDWLNLGTLNAEGGVAMSQHISLAAGLRFNPWTYRKRDAAKQFENRKQCYYAGLRYWPWHVYSGWWTSLHLQYQEYNRGGLFKPQAEEGDAYGIGISLGYTLMIHKSFNLEFGVGAWAGAAWYTAYSCPFCGSIVSSGTKAFLWPDNVMVSFVYIL